MGETRTKMLICTWINIINEGISRQTRTTMKSPNSNGILNKLEYKLEKHQGICALMMRFQEGKKLKTKTDFLTQIYCY